VKLHKVNPKMRIIVAIIQPTKLSAVRESLKEIGVDHLTVCDALGYGRQRGQVASFRGNQYQIDLLRKIELEIVAAEERVEAIIETIRRAALTGAEGQIGDGKIFVLPVAEAIDLAEARRGNEAL
jgi:nitrogen regulatory protein P-II 1